MLNRFRLLLLLGMCISITACGTGSNGGTTLAQANAYLGEGDYRGAVLTLKNILKDNPDDKSARLLLGKVYLPIGDGASAEKELKRAEQLGISPNELLASMGSALLLQGKVDDVLALLHPLKQADNKTNAEILSVKGDAFLAKQDQEEAWQIYQQALDLDPASKDAMQGLIKISVVRGKVEQGFQMLDKLIVVAPQDSETWNLQGLLYSRKKQYAKSEESYQKAAELLHEKQLSRAGFTARTGLVQAQLAQNHLEKALGNVDILLKAQPANPLPKYMRALIAYEQKDYKQAQEYLTDVISVMPSNIPSRRLMGAVQYALGNYELARENLQRVVNEVPGQIQARKLLAAVLLKQNNPRDALQVLKESEGKVADDTQLLAMMGRAALSSGDLSSSLGFYKKATEQSPNEPSVRTELARLYFAQGSYQDAIKELEQIGGEAGNNAKKMIVYANIRDHAYDKAMAVAQELATENPKDASIPVIFGVIELSRGERGKAREHFLKSRSMSPGFEPALLSLARMDYEEGNFNKAVSWYDEIREKSPNSLRALLGMAQIAERRGDTAQALDWVNKAIKGNPKALAPVVILVNYQLKDKQYQKVDETIARAEQHFPGKLELQQLKIKSLLAQGKLDDVIAIFAELIKQQPNNAANYLRTAKVYEQKNDLNQAQATLLMAKKKIPEDETLTIAIVKLETKLGDFESAHRFIKEQKHWTNEALPYGLEGDVYLRQQKYAEAQRAFQKGLSLSDSYLYVVKLVIAKQKTKDLSGAKSIIRNWVDKHPKDSKAHLSLAQLYMNIGANQDAIKLYERINNAIPNNPVVLNNLAWLYRLENDERALGTAKMAYQLAPKSSGVLDTYGWLLVSEGQITQGIPLLREASTLSGGNPEIQFHLAFALAKQNSGKEEAKSLLQALLKDSRFRDRPEVQRLKGQLGL